ncbi:MAG: hypothetical protein ACI82A_001614 [Candidatus Azotimanducaceae bacterium]|jgi:hypothetical protein
MNWEAAGAVGEILSAIVVVATMFYLTTQIRQSQRSNQMVAASRVTESADAWLGQLVRDKILNDIYQKGIRNYESLELSDRNRFDLLIMQLLRAIEGAWINQELGFLDQRVWYGYKITTQRVVGTPGGTIAFNKQRMGFSPEFSAAIDDMIAITNEPQPLSLPLAE